MSYETLLVERRGHVGWLVLNRPDALNAMDARMLHELPAAWIELDEDPTVRVIVVTGSGRALCTGVDVKQLAGDLAAMKEHSRNLKRFELQITNWHMDVWKPVICAVNGICAGGGLHFVADADIVVCSSDATFFDPHTSIGQVVSYEAIGLARRMPFEAVLRMTLMGRHEQLNATRAHELGLVSEIIDPPERLHERVQEIAELIARNSPAAIIASKKALWGAKEWGLTQAMKSGGQHLVDFWRHPDSVEGPAAFAAKREPEWADTTPTSDPRRGTAARAAHLLGDEPDPPRL